MQGDGGVLPYRTARRPASAASSCSSEGGAEISMILTEAPPHSRLPQVPTIGWSYSETCCTTRQAALWSTLAASGIQATSTPTTTPSDDLE